MENKEIIVYMFIGILFIFCLILFWNTDPKGNYDYCIEWVGFSNGTLHRNNLLFTCYNIATTEFYCDYKILGDGRLEIKNVLNVTKNDEGGTIEIIYDEPNYFQCKRWLKSKHLNN